MKASPGFKPWMLPMDSCLEVICGPMFASKTEELISRVKRAVIAKQKVIVYKPNIDHRYGNEIVLSHGNVNLEEISGIKPRAVSTFFDMTLDIDKEMPDVIAIEEVQFFKARLLTTISSFMDGTLVCKSNPVHSIKFICSGLDLDAFGKPFGIMPQLLAMADRVTKKTAVCVICRQRSANRTHRTISTTEQVVVGGSESYEPRCLKCWRDGQSQQVR